MLLLRITRNLISWNCLLFDDEQLLCWQNTHQISPGLVNFCWSYYQLQKTNSELLSVTKLKEEQECQWRLEKQVQAHEMQKQKKRYLINIHIIRSPVKWLSQSRLVMDQNRPITMDLCHLSLTANNMMAKLTSKVTQTRLSTFKWPQPFTWLWRWLLHRLSRHLSPLSTTVLLSTTLSHFLYL